MEKKTNKKEKAESRQLVMCRLLEVKEREDDFVFTVSEIDFGLENEIGNALLLTGMYSGHDIPSIFTIENESYSNVYCWTENIQELEKLFSTTDMDTIRSVMEECLIGKRFIKNKNDTKISLLNDDYEIDDEEEEEETQEEKSIEEPKTVKKEVVQQLLLKDIITKIKESVLSQDDQVRKIATAIYSNQKILDSGLSKEQKFQSKKNILIIGESGTGKTEIIRQLTKELNLPYIVVDANDYTIAGYKGKDIESILNELLTKVNGNMEDAKRAVVIIDEIDKLGDKGDISSIKTTGVQSGLLKMIEGSKVELDEDDNETGEKIVFDTSELTFVFAGAFSSIFEMREKEKKSLGFTSSFKKDIDNKKIIPEDLIKFGLIPEFIGRIPLIVQMNNLSYEDHKKIMTTSKISLLKILKEYYESLGINIKYSDDFIDAVARESVKLKTGARGIKTILNEVFDEIETDVLNGDINEVNLTKENVYKIRKREEQVINK